MDEQKIHFETQGLFSLNCGLHSVNHLLGKRQYTQQTMNDICYELSNALINPHKYILGGDYDINVLMIALQKQGFQYKWHDRRLKIQIDKQFNRILGYLININQGKLYHKLLGISGRHWVVAKFIGKMFYLLDSSKDNPQQINNHIFMQTNQTSKITQKGLNEVKKQSEMQILNESISSTQNYLNKVLQQQGEIIVIYKNIK